MIAAELERVPHAVSVGLDPFLRTSVHGSRSGTTRPARLLGISSWGEWLSR